MRTTATHRPEARPRVWQDFQLPAPRHMARILRSWWAARRAERDLHELDDRMLKDIGIARSQFRSPIVSRWASSRPFAF